MSGSKLSIGIVGLPNVGKSTLFKKLTAQDVVIANYPFATIDPNVGIVLVPDERVDRLAELSKSKKKIPAVVEFYDIAGLVKGASKGEGLGNQFLSHIRDTQAIVIVLRVFKNPEIIHIENSVDPSRDLEIINTELILKDLESVEKRLVKAEGEARTGAKDAVALHETLQKIKAYLDSEQPLVSSQELMKLYLENIGMRSLNLLTAKRQLYLLNGVENEVGENLKKKIKDLHADYLIADLNTEYSEAISDLSKKAYAILNLASFFTTGEDETRAWTIEQGMKAPQAAGVIHTDFDKKFIRLEVVTYPKLIEAANLLKDRQAPTTGAWNQAKQKGWLRVEGKDYIVRDGDVVVVRHG